MCGYLPPTGALSKDSVTPALDAAKHMNCGVRREAWGFSRLELVPHKNIMETFNDQKPTLFSIVLILKRKRHAYFLFKRMHLQHPLRGGENIRTTIFCLGGFC